MTQRAFVKWALVIAVLRLLFALTLPLTGDEAYYIIWGKYPSLGYYDHPPLVGWVHWLLSLFVGQSVTAARLMAIALTTICGWILTQLLSGLGEEKSAGIGLAYLLAPFNFLFVISCPDIMVLTAFMAALWFIQESLIEDSWIMAFTGGAFLGLAALGKFIAIVGIPGLIIYALLTSGWQRSLKNLAVAAAPAIFGGALCLWTSYQNCWSNVRFNFGRIDSGSEVDWSSIGTFAGTLLFLLLPHLLSSISHLLRVERRSRHRKSKAKARLINFSLRLHWIFWGSILIFAYVSMHHIVGLHWFLAVYPPSFAVLGYFEVSRIKVAQKVAMLTTGVMVLGVLCVLMLPDRKFKQWQYYPDLIVSLYPEELCAAIDDFVGVPGFWPATRDYSHASILEISCQRSFLTLEVGSKYGRSYDQFHDFRELDGQLVVYVSPKPIEVNRMGEVLHSYRVGSRSVEGLTFHMIVGTFSYQDYRSLILRTAYRRFYSSELPLPEPICFMNDRYQL